MIKNYTLEEAKALPKHQEFKDEKGKIIKTIDVFYDEINDGCQIVTKTNEQGL